jgi:hypothetical protein
MMLPKAFGAAMAAAAMIACHGVAAQQPTQTPLPDVNVTAPAAPHESFVTRGFTTPYVGHTRVEEDKWPVIPCASARISTTTGAGTCQNGAPTETSLSLSSNSTSPNCTIYHQLVTFQVGALSVEADTLIFDPYKIVAGSPTGHQDKNCFVWSGYLRLPDDFHDMNQVTRRGSNWQNFANADKLRTMEFRDGPHACLAVEKLGPPWHGGYIWVVHASICQPDARPLQTADVTTALTALRLDRYDPLGNLKAPSDDTAYSAAQ